MILEGNVGLESKNFKDWIIGNFREEESPFKTDKFEMKWGKRQKGFFAPAKENGEDKLTLGILVYGKIRIKFLDEDKETLLKGEGDYYFCNPTGIHEVEALEDSLIITIRWN